MSIARNEDDGRSGGKWRSIIGEELESDSARRAEQKSKSKEDHGNGDLFKKNGIDKVVRPIQEEELEGEVEKRRD